MYQNALENIRNIADQIRQGTYESPEKEVPTSGLMEKPKRPEKPETDRAPTFEENMLEAMLAIREIEEFGDDLEPQAKQEANRPRAREDFYEDTGLTEDTEFMKQLERLQEKYPGLNKSELFKVMKGESAFNPRAQNKDTNAAGLFQFIPSTAAELGYTTDDILSMAPTEQLMVYEQYLDRWGYDGRNSLGILQAAPAYANASPDTVVYERGSKAWKVNPGWRSEGDGDITVASINSYYRNQ